MLPLVLERLGLLRPKGASQGWALSVPAMVLLSFSGACFTGLLAQLRLPLPFTPVPVTGQVLAVLICGALLGDVYGLLSQIIYLGLGVSGVPWFAGGTAGIGVLFGPGAATGGYLIGFVVAAFFVGACTRHFPRWRTLEGQVKLMLLGVGIIYLFGALYLMAVLRVGLGRALMLGVAPFVAGDVLKAVLAALFTSAILPQPSPTAAGRTRTPMETRQ